MAAGPPRLATAKVRLIQSGAWDPARRSSALAPRKCSAAHCGLHASNPLNRTRRSLPLPHVKHRRGDSGRGDERRCSRSGPRLALTLPARPRRCDLHQVDAERGSPSLSVPSRSRKVDRLVVGQVVALAASSVLASLRASHDWSIMELSDLQYRSLKTADHTHERAAIRTFADH